MSDGTKKGMVIPCREKIFASDNIHPKSHMDCPGIGGMTRWGESGVDAPSPRRGLTDEMNVAVPVPFSTNCNWQSKAQLVRLHAKRRHTETAHGDVWKQRFSVKSLPSERNTKTARCSYEEGKGMLLGLKQYLCIRKVHVYCV